MSELVLENQNELPKGWVSCLLEDITYVVLGQSPPSSTYNERRNGLPFFQGKLDFGDLYPTPRVWCSKPMKIAEPNDVLLSVRAPVGTTNLSNQQCCIGRGLCAIRPKIQDTPSMFLLYFFRNIEQYLDAKGTGTTFKAISGQQIRSLKIPFPPLNEQKRIVAKIEELFSLVDFAKETLKKTTEQVRIYEKVIIFNMLLGKYTKNWRKNNPSLSGSDTLSKIFEERKQFLDKKYEEIEPEFQNTLTIPDSWNWTSLHNISKKIVDGTHFTPQYVDSGMPFLSVKDIKNDEIDFNNSKFISNEEHDKLIKRCNPEFNDVLITKSGTIGRTAVVNTKKPFSLFVSVALIKIFPEHVNPYYLNYVLKNFMNHIDISQKIKGGVIKNFHLEDLRLVPIPIPNIKEQNEIVKKIEEYSTIIINYRRTIDLTQQKIGLLKSSILKTAFEGKLVPQDPNDEPAEILLQKIKQEKQKIINQTARKKNNGN